MGQFYRAQRHPRTLAHRGTLFLDEATEFRRDALQALRQPIEDGLVTLSRARYAVTYPSRFQLILAANPCPCGHSGDTVRVCQCAPGRITAYNERLSGPLLDRIDMNVAVMRVGRDEMLADDAADTSADVRERVRVARRRQRERLAPLGIATNAEIPVRRLTGACRATREATKALEHTTTMYGLSMRGAHRLLRVARTLADIEGTDVVHDRHVSDAAAFRLS